MWSNWLSYSTDKELETWNNTGTAFKSTMSNLQEKLLPDLVKYPQVRSLYPDVTDTIITRLEQHLNKVPNWVFQFKLALSECCMRAHLHVHYFEYNNFNESTDFCSVERAQDVLHALYVKAIPQGNLRICPCHFQPCPRKPATKFKVSVMMVLTLSENMGFCKLQFHCSGCAMPFKFWSTPRRLCDYFLEYFFDMFVHF